ncbi:MAG: sugar ABC transporter permease [Anaerolineae bacterium]
MTAVTLLVLPGFALFLIFLIIPVVQAAFYSLYKWNGLGALTDFVGIDNFVRLLNHKIFIGALQHTLIIVTLSLLVQLPVALGLALLVGRGNLRGKKLFRMIFFVPFVFSDPITAIIWRYVYHKDGLINTVASSLLPGFHSQTWLGLPDMALFAIFIVLTWKYFGLHMILYMAALQGVPKELEDAARIDGATEINVLRHVTIPLIGSTIRLTVYLSVLGSLQQFLLVWVLTEGGPVNATETIATYMYKFGFQRFALGYGSAVAVVLLCMTLIFSLGYQRAVMRQDFAE